MNRAATALRPLGLPLRSWRWLLLSAVLFAATLAFGFAAKRFGSPGPDLSIDEGLAGDRTAVLTAAALVLNLVFTPAGNVIILAGICLVLMFGLRAPLTSLAFGSVTCAGWLSSEIGKITVARLRPPTSATHALILETGHGSFPSGHTAFAASLAWAAVLVLARSRRQRTVTAAAGALFVVVVGASRLYLGVHYPSDVAGSVLISTAAIMFWLPLWNGWIEPRLRTVRILVALSGNRGKDAAADGRPW